MISSNESDYQQFESLLAMLNSSDIKNVKLNKKYFSIISESVDTLYQMCKHSLNDYPIFNISCKSLLTYIIGRFYFKRKYFKNPNFFDCESNKIFNKTDFIVLKFFTSNIRLIYLIQTKQLFIQKSQHSNLVREHSIYKLFQNAQNFIKCIGVTERNSTIESLIIQYMSNGTLSNIGRILNKNTAKFERKIILILVEIVNQLYMLHSKNVFHRDLKPDNIFIDNNCRAFIGDFGFYLEFNEFHKMTSDIGSNAYSSPETLSKDIHSKESDIYSFGCIIYFIFTNKHFFFDKNNSEVDKLIKDGIKNEDMRNIFIKCVKKDPSLRPTACDIMIKMIEISKKLNINLPDILINDFVHTYSKQYNLNGDKDFLYFMIRIKLFYGFSCQRDIKLGLFYLTISADEGNADAQISIFSIYFKGVDVKRDINKSIHYLTLSANQNQVNAMMLLGCYYSEKMFNSIDAEKAIYYLTKAAKEKWEGFIVHINYTTNEYYDLCISSQENGFSISIEKKSLPHPITHTSEEYNFPDKLYSKYYPDAQAYGILEEGDKLVATIEISPEEWSNRLRITELWVSDHLRRKGIGHALMEIAKKQARKQKRRAIILETQSCNANAIGFYLHEGFTLIGFDTCCYSNNDIERKEVRFEMGYFFSYEK